MVFTAVEYDPICRLSGWLTYSDTEVDGVEDVLSLFSELDPNIGGHVTVISGCRWDGDTNRYMFTVNDPLVSNDEPNIYERSFEQLVFNVNDSGALNEITLWFPSVVGKTRFAEKSLLEEVFLEYEFDSQNIN